MPRPMHSKSRLHIAGGIEFTTTAQATALYLSKNRVA
jgi:hypothetical protein